MGRGHSWPVQKDHCIVTLLLKVGFHPRFYYESFCNTEHGGGEKSLQCLWHCYRVSFNTWHYFLEVKLAIQISFGFIWFLQYISSCLSPLTLYPYSFQTHALPLGLCQSVLLVSFAAKPENFMICKWEMVLGLQDGTPAEFWNNESREEKMEWN